jgi:outer membrane receptor for ferrienterochelin and colicin
MKKLTSSFILVLCSIALWAQQSTVSGRIIDANTGEHLIGASVYNARTKAGCATNTYGFYSLTQPSDTLELRISYVGYQPREIKFLLKRDTVITISLSSGTELEVVEVTSTREDQIQESTRMGTIDVPIAQIKSMPALLGEVDVLKVLQLLPGVQSGTEGSSGLYVRGGGPDQNLILLDGVPVYNASHLFGFFSVFNADAINHVELVKGGFPARYGGRLSSVIDISMKEGNSNKLQGEGAVGLIASRLTIEGPIGEATSFIVSGRRTYIDLLTRPLIRSQTGGNETGGYYFYDLNAKINHTFNERNRLYLSVYSGDDKAFARSRGSFEDPFEETSGTFRDEFNLQWGNITTALRWNKVLTKNLFSNVTATFSRYRFLTGGESDESRTTTNPDTTIRSYSFVEYTSGIRDFALKADFDYLPTPEHYIKFGAQIIDHLFTPGILNYDISGQQPGTAGAKRTSAIEYALYVEDDFVINRKLKINAGLHASGFSVDESFYTSLQPRISSRYLLSNDLSIKASYATMTQFIHLLSNVGIGLPTDLWVSATDKIKPQNAMQVAIGGAYNIHNDYELSLEGYYKEMEGLIEYKDGASYLNLDQDWQEKVEVGRGQAYGAEIFAHKKTGKMNGWVGYTLSWVNRQFDNLNEGRVFPYRYDRRHDVEFAGSYKTTKNKEFGFTWVYASGAAVTLPTSTYARNAESPDLFTWSVDQDLQYFDSRNGFRMRSYHRLDFSYTTTKKKKWGERSWVIAIYNVYNRRNPFFLDLTTDDRGKKTFVQYSLFPIIPSVSYRFKF